MQSSQDPIPSTGGKHYPQRFSPRREETDLHIGLANLSVLYQEDLIPKMSGFENQWNLTFVRVRELSEAKTLLLKMPSKGLLL